MNKYRITAYKNGHGDIYYRPERRVFLFFWRNLKTWWQGVRVIAEYDELQYAQRRIDEDISDELRKQRKVLSNKRAKVS